MLQSGCGIVRVHRNISCTGAHDAKQCSQHLRGTIDHETNHSAGAEADIEKVLGNVGAASVKLAVGETSAPAGNGGLVRNTDRKSVV